MHKEILKKGLSLAIAIIFAISATAQAAPVSIQQNCLRPQVLGVSPAGRGLSTGFSYGVPNLLLQEISALTGKGDNETGPILKNLINSSRNSEDLIASLNFITQQIELEDEAGVLKGLSLAEASNAIRLLIAISINARQARATKVCLNPAADATSISQSLSYIVEEKGIDFANLSSSHTLPESIVSILTKDRLVTYETEAAHGLRYDISKAMAAQVSQAHGITPEELIDIESRLLRIKQEIDAERSQDELRFLDFPSTINEEDIGAVEDAARFLNNECEDIVIINGESTGAKAAFDALTDPLRNQIAPKKQRGGARIHYLDSADEEDIHSLLDALRVLNSRSYSAKTGIIVISPDILSDSVTRAVYDRLKEELSSAKTAFITDKRFVEEIPDRDFLLNENETGLRGFFTPAGLLPLALAGIDIRKVVAGGKSIVDTEHEPEGLLDNFAYLCPVIYYLLSHSKDDAGGEAHVKNLIALLLYSEMGKGLGSIFADTLNTALVNSELLADAAIGTKSQHFNLQAYQKAHNLFLVHTFGLRNFSNDPVIGESAEPNYANLPMSEAFDACRQGVREAMQAGKRPNIDTTLEKLDPFNTGMLISLIQLESIVLAKLFDAPVAAQHEDIEELHREAEDIRKRGLREEEGLLDISTYSGIRFRFDGALDAKIGENDGITYEELNSLLLDLLRIQGEIQKEGIIEHPWLEVPEDMIEELADLKGQARNFAQHYDDIVVVGIGGSSAGNRAGIDIFLNRFFNLFTNTERRGYPRVTFLGDNIDPDQIHHTLNHLDSRKTGVIVISKSGVTAEPNIVFATIRSHFESKGLTDFADHVCAITDRIDGILIKEARSEGYRVVPHPEKVGGRWTLFTAVSAFLFGTQDIDLRKFYSAAKRFVDTCYKMDGERLKQAREELERAINSKDEGAIRTARARALEVVKENPALLYGGLSTVLNEKKGKDISMFLILPERMRSFREWVIQLYNESLGKPGVKLFTVAKHGLRNIIHNMPKLIRARRCMYTIINAEPVVPSHDGSSVYRISDSYQKAISEKLLMHNHPVLNIDLPRLDEATFAELALFFFGSTVIESKKFVEAKAVSPYGQAGVLESKRRTLRILQSGKRAKERLLAKRTLEEKELAKVESIIDLGSVVPGIDEELKNFIEKMVTGLWPAISEEIEFGIVGAPDLREKRLADIITGHLKDTKNYPLLHSIWLRDAPEPEFINGNGRFLVAVTPIENSESIEKANVSAGSLFGIYERTPDGDKLLSSFLLIRGPGLSFVGYIQGQQAGHIIRNVYDFKLSEEGRLEPRESPGRPDIQPWVEMKFTGTRSALHGRECDWMPAFRTFKRYVWDKRPLAVRYSNSVADPYEVLLNGGLWMDALTPLEALQLGHIFESAGGYGRSLVMTESGPISASQIDLSNYEHRFNPEHQTFAFFGSKEIIDILEAYFVFLGSDLDLTDFANNLNAAIRSQQVQRNPQLKTVLLMLNLKLQSALAYHQDKEIADGVVKILSSSVDEHEQQRFIEGLLASLKEELAYLAYLPFDEILNKLDLDRYVLLASPQLIDKLRYELEMKPSIEQKIITALSDHFQAVSVSQLINRLVTTYRDVEVPEALFGNIDSLREFYRANTIDVHNMGWRKPEQDRKEELTLRSSEGRITLNNTLSSIERSDRPFAREAVQIIRNLLAVTVERAIPAFKGEEIGYFLGETNKPGDEIADLDVTFHALMMPPIFDTGVVRDVISEEARHIIASFIDEWGKTYEGNPTSPITVKIDPLDGSSKVETNGTVGMIMGVEAEGRMIAALFVLFGGQKSLIFASEFTEGVWEYRLTKDGEFVKVAPFEIPSVRGKQRIGLALGGRRSRWAPEQIEYYVSYLENVMGGYSTYSGSYVSDLLRTTFDGGMYIYPALNDRKTKGRLRPYETRPVGYIFKKAGGTLSTGIVNNLEIALDPDIPKYPHQIEPIIIGSRDIVLEFEAYVLNTTSQGLIDRMRQEGLLTTEDATAIIAGQNESRLRPIRENLYEYTGRLKRGRDQLHPEERRALALRMEELIRFEDMKNSQDIRRILEMVATQQSLILPLHMPAEVEIDDGLLDTLTAKIVENKLLMYPEKEGGVRLIVNVEEPEAIKEIVATLSTESPRAEPMLPNQDMGNSTLDSRAVDLLNRAIGAWEQLWMQFKRAPESKAIKSGIDEIVGTLTRVIEGDEIVTGFKDAAEATQQKEPKQNALRNLMLATHMRSNIESIIYADGKLTEDKNRHALILPADETILLQLGMAEDELIGIRENLGIEIVASNDLEGAVSALADKRGIAASNIVAFTYAGQTQNAQKILGQQNVFTMEKPKQNQYVPFSQLAILTKIKLIIDTLDERRQGPYKSALEIIWKQLTGAEQVDVDMLINDPAKLILTLLATPEPVLNQQDLRYLHRQASVAWA